MRPGAPLDTTILPFPEEKSVHELVDFGKSSAESPARLVQVRVFLYLSDDPEVRIDDPVCWSGTEWVHAGRTNYHGNGGSDTG
jgi:hypothetical protein